VGEKEWNWSDALHVGLVQRDPPMVPPLELVEPDDEEPELEAPDDEEPELVEAPDDEEPELVWPPPDDEEPGAAPDPDDDPEPPAVPPDPDSPLPFEPVQAATSRPRPMARERCIMANLTGQAVSSDRVREPTTRARQTWMK
jgi:hypothetical protein